MVGGLQSASAPQLAHAPDLERVRYSMSVQRGRQRSRLLWLNVVSLWGQRQQPYVFSIGTVFLTGLLTYRESEVPVGNSAMADEVFSNHFTVCALCFIFSTSPA
jgi:hypothetical protein